MKKLGMYEIRRRFLDFFEEKGHLILPSFSLVPKNDKSLLLINAGMAPLKPYFTGESTPPKKRVTTCQKCLRTGDIENVGKTDRHATFFEMLGNFSFGDYFKEEIIEWAWEFLTQRLEVPKESIWVSVYQNDDEAFNIWNKKVGIDKNKIVRLGKEDNFWELEVGPCGPCSEIYVDRGKKYGCGSPDCKPGCECDRFVEIWNLVFSQYDKDKKGNYNPLPNPNIDTGMGLERIAAVMQDANNIFEVDIINKLLKEVEKVAKVSYKKSSKQDESIRIITDHIRAVTFMVSDGIFPSNEGRGYVLRRLIRRASRHGKLLGINKEFLSDLCTKVIEIWKDAYPELKERENQIKKVIKAEELKFQETINQGIEILEGYISDMKSEKQKVLSGTKAFKLYDTYGFPIDLTKEILQEKGLLVDEKSFNEEMNIQKERARKARTSQGSKAWGHDEMKNKFKEFHTVFKGYDKLKLNSKIIAIVYDNEFVGSLKYKEKGIIILDETPFYGECGGQVGDTGVILGEDFKASVLDTKKLGNDVVLHFVEIKEGNVNKDEQVLACVDYKRRMSLTRNHSATHLVHEALKQVLGDHVNQAGSLVLPDKLRFDFTHFEGISKEDLDKIEKIVNEKILEGLEVNTIETTLDEARKMGAMALFDEKYEDKVRMVQMGDFSKELCGGTHVRNTSNIGLFKILSESSVASGVRRIEAITGMNLYKYVRDLEDEINNISLTLKTDRKSIIAKVENLNNDVKNKEKEIESLKDKMSSSIAEDVVKSKYKVDDIDVIKYKVSNMDMNSLRKLGDEVKNLIGSGIIVLASVLNNKVSFVVMATDDVVNKGIHSGNLVKNVAKAAGGGGGGRSNMAQAGGKQPDKVDYALSLVDELIKSQLK